MACLEAAGLPKLRLGSGGTTLFEFATLGPGLGDFTGAAATVFFTVADVFVLLCDGFPYVVLGRGGAAPENAAVALLGSLEV